MQSYPIEKSGVALGRRFNKRAARLPVLMPLLFLLVAGCHRDEVKTYRVAKDQNQPQPQSAPAMSTDSPNPTLPPGHPDISSASAAPGFAASGSAQPQLTWKTPEGWTEVPPGEMRVASFKIQDQNGKQADVSVIPLPGLPGSDEANVNRWRGQVGLSVVTDDELQKAAENVEAGSLPAQLYDIAGANPAGGGAERILGVIQHRDDMAWFYKMTGDADLVEQQKPAFIEFLKSLNFGVAAPTQTEMPAANPAMPGTSLGSQNVLVPDANTTVIGGKPNWQVPSGWQEVAGGQFLVAKFTLTGDGGATAAVNVSSSPGDGGGLAANVNRWRGQLGLSPSPDNLATPVNIAGGKASLVDFSGTDARTGQPARLVGIVVSQPNQTWFYKLMGDAKVVASQKDAFIQFVQGVKY